MSTKIITALGLIAMAAAIALMSHDSFLMQWTGAMSFILCLIATMSANCKHP